VLLDTRAGSARAVSVGQRRWSQREPLLQRRSGAGRGIFVRLSGAAAISAVRCLLSAPLTVRSGQNCAKAPWRTRSGVSLP